MNASAASSFPVDANAPAYIDIVTLYRIPYDVQKTRAFTQATDDIKPEFIKRLMNRFGDRLFVVPSDTASADLAASLQVSQMDVFSRVPVDHRRALSPRNMRLVVTPSEDGLTSLTAIRVPQSQILDRIVLPYDAEAGRLFLPFGDGKLFFNKEARVNMEDNAHDQHHQTRNANKVRPDRHDDRGNRLPCFHRQNRGLAFSM